MGSNGDIGTVLIFPPLLGFFAAKFLLLGGIPLIGLLTSLTWQTKLKNRLTQTQEEMADQQDAV